MRISAVKGIYCDSCVSLTLKCDACSRHDVTLRRGKFQKRTTIHSKTSNSTKTSTVVKDFFQSNLFQNVSRRLYHFFNSSRNLGEKYVYVRKPTSTSLFPIEFNGKNGVFGLPVAQKLILQSRNIFTYSDGGAFNTSICKKKKKKKKKKSIVAFFLQHPDLKGTSC